MLNLVKEFAVNESGATAIEYGLIAGLIAVVIIGAAGFLGNNIRNTFNRIARAVNGQTS